MWGQVCSRRSPTACRTTSARPWRRRSGVQGSPGPAGLRPPHRVSGECGLAGVGASGDLTPCRGVGAPWGEHVTFVLWFPCENESLFLGVTEKGLGWGVNSGPCPLSPSSERWHPLLPPSQPGLRHPGSRRLCQTHPKPLGPAPPCPGPPQRWDAGAHAGISPRGESCVSRSPHQPSVPAIVLRSSSPPFTLLPSRAAAPLP